MSVAERIISAKKNGSKRLAGILIFLPDELLDILDDLAAFYGSVDSAIIEAIKLLHNKIYGENLDISLENKSIDIDSLISKLESRLINLLSSVSTANMQQRTTKDIKLDLPELVEVSEDTEEEALDLEDVLEDVMVVAVDDSFAKNEEDNNDKQRKGNSEESSD